MWQTAYNGVTTQQGVTGFDGQSLCPEKRAEKLR